jgi:hypothetical protein
VGMNCLKNVNIESGTKEMIQGVFCTVAQKLFFGEFMSSAIMKCT